MQVDILTLFPEMFSGPLSTSILKRAQDQGLLTVNLFNIRDFSGNKHRTVDDTPYGGGAGMVMEPGPFFRAFDYLRERGNGRCGRVILLTPQGKTFTQGYARELALADNIILICGHYEGVDERVREVIVDDEISIGDYVLTGGEIPAMVIVDAVARLLPGVLGEPTSAMDDSFYNGLLEYPQYTRPREYRGYEVPEILTSGHHENIRKWRRRQSLLRTLLKRPDLLENAHLTDEDLCILREIGIILSGILNKV